MRDPSFEPAWARVSILLNTGDIPGATLAARQASSITRWRWDFGDYQNDPMLKIYDTPLLPVGWMWLEPDKARTLLSSDAVSEFALSSCMWDFAESVLHVREPAFRFYDVGNWRLLDQMTREGKLNDRCE